MVKVNIDLKMLEQTRHLKSIFQSTPQTSNVTFIRRLCLKYLSAKPST